ncbi:hypothetical protein M513_13183 [Trichuris suis]|uniref:Reverse transcriptase domain-containing protein n=2 Tax=Trichuris suis TaxID=68888 RepID=A0A085LLU9_9BILA|nr:hypothetical protein M513_13183 [Trichuris suis]
MASRLGLARKPTDVHLSTFHGRDPLLSLSSVDFAIRGRNGRQQFDIKGALVVPSINVSCRTVNWNRERDKWTHLKDLSLTDVNYGKVSVLIGADNFEVKQPLALRKPPRKGEPFGMLTPLGLYSPQQSEFEIYERFWKTESFGTQPVQLCQDIELSKIAWPSSFEFVHGRYEVGLLWKSDNVTLPNNRTMAKSRFESLRKRLINDPVLYDLYREAISCLSRSGIVRLVMPYEANSPVGRVWYLPHHPVRHPSKPGKVRIVFDASAKLDGLSLNDHLEKGPDLVNDMTSILIRFRCLPVAVVSDVVSMFHQVGVPPRDRSVLRFLWSDRADSAPKTYEFTRQVFGLTSAPSTCIYALLHCIRDFLPSEMAARCSQQFYVDNYLDSFSDAKEAIAYCVALRGATARGGFPLVKWERDRKCSCHSRKGNAR